jgi:ABC-2 type transport system permease protein
VDARRIHTYERFPTVIQTKASGGALTGLRGALREAGIEANKGYAFVERGWNFTKRYWAWEVFWIVYNVVNALSVTFIAASANQINPGAVIPQSVLNQFVLYLAIGTAMWTYISVVFDSVTETVTIERWEGTIEYTFMAPISRLTHMLGTCVFALLHGIVMTIIQVAVLAAFFHLDLARANWGSTAVIVIVGSVSLIGIGEISATLPMLFTERGAQMAYIIRAIMLLVSGVYYPITVLPGFLQAVAKISPATYMLDGLRAAIKTGASVGTLWYDIWPLLICGVVSVPLGLWIFDQAERYAKRTGKLKRNG